MTETSRIKLPPEAEQMSLPDLIKMKRAEKGMTQKELADAAGISISALKQYETGRMEPSMQKVKLLAAVLDLSSGDIWSELPIGSVSDERLRLAVSQQAMTFISGPANTKQLNELKAFIAKFDGTESAEQAAPESAPTALKVLTDVVHEKGFKARKLPKLLEAARVELNETDIDEMEKSADVYQVEFPEDIEHEQAVDWLLCAVLHGEDLMQLGNDVLDEMVDWINEPAGWGDAHVATEGMFESRESYNARLRLTVPKWVINNAINRRFLSESIIKTGS
jgi:transcriptional regulator with XRE-family HTH domain